MWKVSPKTPHTQFLCRVHFHKLPLKTHRDEKIRQILEKTSNFDFLKIISGHTNDHWSGGWNLDCELKMNDILYFSLIFLILKWNDFICVGLKKILDNLTRKNSQKKKFLWLKKIF